MMNYAYHLHNLQHDTDESSRTILHPRYLRPMRQLEL